MRRNFLGVGRCGFVFKTMFCGIGFARCGIVLCAVELFLGETDLFCGIGFVRCGIDLCAADLFCGIGFTC